MKLQRIISYCLAIVLLFTMGNIARANENVNEEPDKVTRILMVGNSSTFFNNMPQMLQEMANADGNNCIVKSITGNGFKLSEFANKTSEESKELYNALETQQWDYVVLQEYRERIIQNPQTTKKSIDALLPYINKAGAKIVLFAPQGDLEGRNFKINGTQMYLDTLQIQYLMSRN